MIYQQNMVIIHIELLVYRSEIWFRFEWNILSKWVCLKMLG